MIGGTFSSSGNYEATDVSMYLPETMYLGTQRLLSANSETDFTGTFDLLTGVGRSHIHSCVQHLF